MAALGNKPTAIVVGAGMGGLVGAVELASQGWRVQLFDGAPALGGKMRQVAVGQKQIDAGPTVLTLRDVFDDVFARAGTRLEHHVTLEPMAILARHAWVDGSTLDLHADVDRSAGAIADFAGAREAEGFRRFLAHARSIWQTVEGPFVRAQRPTPFGILRDHGMRALPMLANIDSHRTLWRALETYFRDPRLVQLFGRYATYTGCSPFLAPATLSLIAWVESAGVWRVRGGIHQLAQALGDVLLGLGGEIFLNTNVAQITADKGRATGVMLANGERIAADCVLFAGDASALGTGLLGGAVKPAVAPTPAAKRSLSALTWCLDAQTAGFPLVHHNVFFGADSASEFQAIFQAGALPPSPTVYVCAQDRDDRATAEGPERLLVLVNAPARADVQPLSDAALARCESATFDHLQQLGLCIAPPTSCVRTSPAEFAERFPASGGALYGAANHSWTATLNRPGARTAIAGLYLAGGTGHPGAGVPMAALSGRLAADAICADHSATTPARARGPARWEIAREVP